MKVISFCLWGDDPKYTEGAIKNAQLAPEIYPGWKCRFYVGQSVPSIVLMRLEMNENTEVVRMPEFGNWKSMYWRFWPAGEEDVEVMISRDTDCRLTSREKEAVDEWLESDKGFHIMRDHPYHAFPVLGGMWGAKRGCLSNMKELIEGWSQKDAYGTDYEFFANVVMPIIQGDIFVHDEFFNGRKTHTPHPLAALQGCESYDFPLPRQELEFVGEVYNHEDNTVPEHTAILENFLKEH
jgi:hypothetical protein|tara:strand:+ start:269 stop:982 length:714 start_codon:yes stop_codon:yes gene_type:complete